MKLSEDTILKLKNYATIHQNIMISEGNSLKTMSNSPTIISETIIEDEFPKDFGIYDLNEFLSVLNLIEDPELKFEDKYLTVEDTNGLNKIKYFYSPANLLIFPKNSYNYKDDTVFLEFNLDQATMKKMLSAANTLNHNTFELSIEDDKLNIKTVEIDNETSNTYTMKLPSDYKKDKFKLYVSKDIFKFIPGDYKVQVNEDKVIRFVCPQHKIFYVATLDSRSKV